MVFIVQLQQYYLKALSIPIFLFRTLGMTLVSNLVGAPRTQKQKGLAPELLVRVLFLEQLNLVHAFYIKRYLKSYVCIIVIMALLYEYI